MVREIEAGKNRTIKLQQVTGAFDRPSEDTRYDYFLKEFFRTLERIEGFPWICKKMGQSEFTSEVIPSEDIGMIHQSSL